MIGVQLKAVAVSFDGLYFGENLGIKRDGGGSTRGVGAMDRITKAHGGAARRIGLILDGVHLENNRRSDGEAMERGRALEMSPEHPHNDRARQRSGVFERMRLACSEPTAFTWYSFPACRRPSDVDHEWPLSARISERPSWMNADCTDNFLRGRRLTVTPRLVECTAPMSTLPLTTRPNPRLVGVTPAESQETAPAPMAGLPAAGTASAWARIVGQHRELGVQRMG